MLAGEPRLMLTWVNYVKNFSENNFIYVPTIDNERICSALWKIPAHSRGVSQKNCHIPFRDITGNVLFP
jgi:hypothetical protein